MPAFTYANGADTSPIRSPKATPVIVCVEMLTSGSPCRQQLSSKSDVCPCSDRHEVRPMPFVKRVEAGLHIAQPVKVAKPFGYGAEDYALA